MICEELFYIATATDKINFNLINLNVMTLFILYQTDIWKSKASRIFFGIFDTRSKAVDIAKYNGLYCASSKVVIEEIKLNQFEEN